MIIAGLTGSIGMGKSAIAAYLREQGIPVLDADALVHDLYRGKAAVLIEQAFPGTTQENVVDRQALSRAVLGSDLSLKKLEAIVHPLVKEGEWQFLQQQMQAGADLAVLEIPLLFETGAQDFFDKTIVASAPPEIQRNRVLNRPGVTAEKFEAILARQWPDSLKRKQADFVVDTNVSFPEMFAQISGIVEEIKRAPSLAYKRWASLYDTKAENDHAGTRS